MPRLFLALVLLLGGVSCREIPVVPGDRPDPLPEQQDPWVIEEKPLPTKAEWLERLLQRPDEEPDLVEAITVVACERLKIRREYSTIPLALAPYVRSARKRLNASSTADDKIDALNEVVLPAIRRGLKGEFAWLVESVQSPEEDGEKGSCFVSSMLYLIAADMLPLRLEMFHFPRHVALCHISPQRRRNIECTDRGQHLPFDHYRKQWLRSDPEMIESIPEDKETLERYCSPFSRRQVVTLLLRQGARITDPGTEEVLKAAIRIAPDFYVPWKFLSGFYAHHDRWAEGEVAITKAIEVAPHLTMYRAVRAMGRMVQGKGAPALEDIDAALAMSPNYPKYHQCKGGILFLAERYREASTSFQRAVDGAPHSQESWKFLGHCYKKLKEYAKAADAYTRAIEIDPRNARYYDLRAEMWAMLGDEQRWEADRRKVKELGGDRD